LLGTLRDDHQGTHQLAESGVDRCGGVGVAAAATALWAAGGLGVVARGGETPGWMGKLYDGLYERIPGF